MSIPNLPHLSLKSISILPSFPQASWSIPLPWEQWMCFFPYKFAFSRVFYTWSHTPCCLFCVTSLRWFWDVSIVLHAPFSFAEQVYAAWACNIYLCSLVDGHLTSSWFCTALNKLSLWNYIQVFMNICFPSLGKHPGVEFLCRMPCVYLMRSCQTAFQRSCIVFVFSWTWMGDPLVLSAQQHLILWVLLISVMPVDVYLLLFFFFLFFLLLVLICISFTILIVLSFCVLVGHLGAFHEVSVQISFHTFN